MDFRGDFHLHSHYSRATSRELTPANLDLWGRVKGISVIGTADFTHPGWVSELEESLVPAEEGLFRLREDRRMDPEGLGIESAILPGETRFLLTAEISSIYKQGEKVRKVHNLIFAPDFAAASRIQKQIEHLGGNIRSDGRPILGIDSRDLLELCLDADERIFFVPAHIWTPWFSALGSKSGFDSIEECFRDLSNHISAVETGLSSDPPMNWMCSFLDTYTLISNSDAHSPQRLGREACLFDAELSYPSIITAMKQGAHGGFRGTIEFFPQEGKYHFDGHRKCGLSWDPFVSLRNGGICTECGRPVTIGVLNRVAELADRKDVNDRPARDPFYSLIPLAELLAETSGTGAGSKRVRGRYAECINSLGPELDILLRRDRDEIARREGGALAESVIRMRERRVHVTAGYDGEYGSIRVWSREERPPADKTEDSLFPSTSHAPGLVEDEATTPAPLGIVEFDLAGYQEAKAAGESAHEAAEAEPRYSTADGGDSTGLNPQQREAAEFAGGPSIIVAGPGTGKTHTIVEKVRNLVQKGATPGGILVVTFTNKASGEIRRRLVASRLHATGTSAAGDSGESDAVQVMTFHGFGLGILKKHLSLLGRDEGACIIDEEDKNALLAAEGVTSQSERKRRLEYVSQVKSGLVPVPDPGGLDFGEFHEYQQILKRSNCFDFDDLVYLPVRLFQKRPEVLEQVRAGIDHLIIDEYQDINPAQYEFVRAISDGVEVCVVGDPNQSIYGFRGASPRFMDLFRRDFPDARVFSLTRSYRCPDTVLKASASVLALSESALLGPEVGAKITIVRTPTAAFEAEQIARDIEARTGGVGFFSIDSGVSDSSVSGEVGFSEIAVLCRTSLQMPPLEKAFHDHRIPFRTIRTESLFTREPYRSFLNLVRMLVQKGDGRRLTPGKVKGVAPDRIEGLPAPASRGEALAMFDDLVSGGSGDAVAGEMEEEIARYWDDAEVAAEFIDHARLGAGADRYDSRVQAVTLMTIHAAKGLEFGVVYVPGCEESLLPCTLSGEGRTDVDEERRLLYVAMTRAKSSLILSCARSRVLFGKSRVQQESPFLALIDEELAERQQRKLERKSPASIIQHELFD